MSKPISSAERSIDSRDIIERLEHLKNTEITPLEAEELAELEKLAEDAAPFSVDWDYGVQLIRDDYFEQFMDEMVADCYEIPRDLPSWMVISYDYAALKTDYAPVQYFGQTYWMR